MEQEQQDDERRINSSIELKWIPLAEVDFSDTNIQQYHVDTRDFHVLCNPKPKEEPVDTSTIGKYPERFFFTADEVGALINRYYTESGGMKSWRFFFLKKHDNWQMKYIRIYRTERGLVVCNGDSRAQNKETLNSQVGKNEYT